MIPNQYHPKALILLDGLSELPERPRGTVSVDRGERRPSVRAQFRRV